MSGICKLEVEFKDKEEFRDECKESLNELFMGIDRNDFPKCFDFIYIGETKAAITWKGDIWDCFDIAEIKYVEVMQ